MGNSLSDPRPAHPIFRQLRGFSPGKSTLFNILGGLTPATTGNIHINRNNLADMTNAERTNLRKKTVGFVFQKYNLLPTLSAEDNIRLLSTSGIATRHSMPHSKKC
jgi:ABC-type lipoprotein export system ATPase subunit